jgi:hypothetical protein
VRLCTFNRQKILFKKLNDDDDDDGAGDIECENGNIYPKNLLHGRTFKVKIKGKMIENMHGYNSVCAYEEVEEIVRI